MHTSLVLDMMLNCRGFVGLQYWAWLRKQLRRRDLADLVLKRPALTKAGYTERVKSVLRSRVSQHVAKRCALGLKKVCQEVIAKKGAATSA